ncbi:hypothetical protein GGR52DRAFT_261084 [Hypoxylon sp. FL1284]|nr:hypothetical protein GGR52DRAFT_261084 [Hypoxylon sp. FL1284]
MLGARILSSRGRKEMRIPKLRIALKCSHTQSSQRLSHRNPTPPSSPFGYARDDGPCFSDANCKRVKPSRKTLTGRPVEPTQGGRRGGDEEYSEFLMSR